MPCGPLADDWLYWDPETIFAYPHSREPEPLAQAEGQVPEEHAEPVQLELFNRPPEGV